ncbi:Protein of unknown function, partial [Gryllus bimaculatus]
GPRHIRAPPTGSPPRRSERGSQEFRRSRLLRTLQILGLPETYGLHDPGGLGSRGSQSS